MRVLKRITLVTIFIFSCHSLQAFQVKSMYSKSFYGKAPVQIEAITMPNYKFKGKLLGIAILKDLEDSSYEITINWNTFIYLDNNLEYDISGNNLMSKIITTEKNININQTIDVKGDIKQVIESNIKDTNSDNSDEDKEKNPAIYSGGGGFGFSGGGDNAKDENSQEELPNIESSSKSCPPTVNWFTKEVVINSEDYYINKAGKKVIVKKCHATDERHTVKYKECSLVNDFNAFKSWKSRSAYVRTNDDGDVELLPCEPYGSSMKQEYDETQCTNKTVGNQQVIYGKRYVIDPENLSKIYVTDCLPVKSSNIKFTMLGCSVDSFLVQKDSYMVYPSGRKYILDNNNRVFLDSDCTSNIDLGKGLTSVFHYWQNNDGMLESTAIHQFAFDFTNLEAGFSGVIPDSDFEFNKQKYKFEYQDYTKGSCGKWYNPKVQRTYYNHYTRADGSSYTVLVNETCS